MVKDSIIQIITNIDLGPDPEVLGGLIEQYEKQYPYDLDLFGYKMEYQLLLGNTEAAYRLAETAVRKNPYNYNANSNMRKACEATGDYILAYKYDRIMNLLEDYTSDNHAAASHKDELIEKIVEQKEQIAASGSELTIGIYKEMLDDLFEHGDTFWGLYDQKYHDFTKLVGTYTGSGKNKKYNAFYDDFPLIFEKEEKFKSSILTKLECLAVTEAAEFQTGGECEYLLPVLSEERNTVMEFQTAEHVRYNCINRKAFHFNYYRVPPKTCVKSSKRLFIGNPIPMKQENSLKKLVLNIFVDGLSQKVLEEEGLAELMPATSRFFSKGVACTNAYTAAEWTQPSIASYVTGLSTVRHMMLHNKLTYPLPEGITVLPEYFKEQGYWTAKIDGDWRSTQSYGYGRGMDRILYQNQNFGMRAEQVIPDVLDHMELMKETNQFIWMCVGDLHDIADGYELKASVQSVIPLENRITEEIGETSAKQSYSRNKRLAYMKQMKHVDDYLRLLYDYIEENYRDEEIVVSLFGDHGQAYLVGPDEHFMADGRAKVGMMFRGSYLKPGVCDELISAKDYICIMCSLAGIAMKNEVIDGKMPVFAGGEVKRDYAISESIHPGDPYRAVLVSAENKLYFTSEGNVEYDGRLILGNYSTMLTDSNGEPCCDTEKQEFLTGLILNHIKELLVY